MANINEDTEIKYLGDVQKLSLRPGDIVVLKVGAILNIEQKTMLKDALRGKLPGHEIMVLDSGMDISVIETTEDKNNANAE